MSGLSLLASERQQGPDAFQTRTEQSTLSKIIERLGNFINPVGRVADHSVQNPATKQQLQAELNRTNPELAKQAQQFQQVPSTSETFISDKGHGETPSAQQSSNTARGHEETLSKSQKNSFAQGHEPVVSEPAKKKTETK